MVRTPCCDKTGLRKGTWTPEEDRKLIEYISRYGYWNWRQLPKFAGLLRCGKSCRLRWMNYLRPNIKRGNFTKEEEDTIIRLHKSLGNRWSAIAAELPGRTDNEVKNHWHTYLKKGSREAPTVHAEKPSSRKKRSYALEISAVNSTSSVAQSNVSLPEMTFETMGSFWEEPFKVDNYEPSYDVLAPVVDTGFLYPNSPLIGEEFPSSYGFGEDNNFFFNW
ncbi:hypothetical protein NMG60_11003053 [Bertholletia excelsa]